MWGWDGRDEKERKRKTKELTTYAAKAINNSTILVTP
jgi:hypothetical protein